MLGNNMFHIINAVKKPNMAKPSVVTSVRPTVNHHVRVYGLEMFVTKPAAYGIVDLNRICVLIT